MFKILKELLKEFLKGEKHILPVSLTASLTSIMAYLVFPYKLPVMVAVQLAIFAIIGDVTVNMIDAHRESVTSNYDCHPKLVVDTLAVAIILYLTFCPFALS